MKINFLRFRTTLWKLVSDHSGQSMTEYALMCALVAFGSTAGYKGLAEEVSVAYNHISGLFTSSGIIGGTGGGQNGGRQNGGDQGGGGHDHGH